MCRIMRKSVLNLPLAWLNGRPRRFVGDQDIEQLTIVQRASQRTSDGRLGSNFQPGMRNCIALASSRAPSPCSW